MTTGEELHRQAGKKWYKRVAAGVVATILAGIVAFSTGSIEKILEAIVGRIGGPLDIVAERVKSCPYLYALPGSPVSVPTPPQSNLNYGDFENDPDAWERAVDAAKKDRDEWERNVGAVDGESTKIRVTVTGKSDRPVILQSLEVDVVDRHESPSSGFISAGLPCGGPVELRYLEYVLDGPNLVESVDGRNDPAITPSPITFPYKVSRTEPEVFLVYGEVVQCDCSWILRLYWTSGDESGTTIIDNDGQPFRTAPLKDLSRVVLPRGETWVPFDDFDGLFPGIR